MKGSVKSFGKVNKDLSKSWECTKCADSGFQTVPSRTTGKKDDENSAKKQKVD